MSLAAFWPFFGLQIATPRLTLRPPTDDDLLNLVELARQGIHDPSTMPFVQPWTDVPSPAFERESLQYWWRCRAELSPEQWDLAFAVECDGQLVGLQNLLAKDFLDLRIAETGSWLGQAHQGQGIGKEMRAAIVAFAFEHLGAQSIVSTAYTDNPASQAVSLATGYEPNGFTTVMRRGQRAQQACYRLTRERWLETRSHARIEVTGFDPCREALGLAEDLPDR